MKKKVTSPQELTGDLSKLDEAISLFEAELRKGNPEIETRFHLIARGEFNRKVCDQVEKLYTEAGWTDVKCRTSSENGERGGLTGLILNRP